MMRTPLRLRARFGVLLGALLVVMFAVVMLLAFATGQSRREERRAWHSEQDRQLTRWLTIAQRPLQELLLDLAPWAGLREFIAAPDATWARTHLDAALADRHVDSLWVLRADGRALYARQRDPAHRPPELPAPDQLAAAERRGVRLHFFASGADGLWQFFAAPVPDGEGVAGWMIVARRWEAAYLRELGELTGHTVRLAAPGAATTGTGDVDPPTWRRELAGLDGSAVREVMFTAAPDTPSLSGDGAWWQTLALFVAFAASLLTALGLALNRWVLQPLGRLGESLRRGTIEPIEPLLAGRDECRDVAQLVVDSFAARDALHHEVEERRRAEVALLQSQTELRHSLELRSRLARDLHDHVIQSIYAAGLGLESVRAQMSVDPFGAEGRIKHCRDNLNETIRQVRSYIADLEPDRTENRQQFPEAVRALAAMMRQLWPVEITLDIDETAAAPLTNVVELHALQIVRECLSNAIRHGHATRVDITLRREDGATQLRVRDNGAGFDPVQRMGTGRGLVNLTTRAREMGATVRIDSTAGAGTTVTVRLGAANPAGNPTP